jgi:hypothetical protein
MARDRARQIFKEPTCSRDRTGGERAAAIYSRSGTAKLNGVDPEAYLRDVLFCIVDHLINRIEDPLPWNLTSEVAYDAQQAA